MQKLAHSLQFFQLKQINKLTKEIYMKTQFRKLILGLTLISVPAMAVAGGPAKYNNCKVKPHIKGVQNGAGVYFNEDCSVAYVLPPAQGKFVIRGLTPNMNLKLCQAYESSINTLNKQYSSLEKLNAYIDNLNNQLVQQDKVNVSDDNLINGDLNIDGGDSDNPLDLTFKPMDPATLEKQKKIIEAITVAQQSIVMTNQSLAMTLQSMAVFDDKKGVAVGKIDYSLNWTAMVDAYRKANPHLRFERLPLEAGRIAFKRKIGATGESVHGAVEHTIPGIQNVSKILADGTLASGEGAVIMGDAISGQVVLNYAAACPFVKDGQMPSELTGSALDAHLSANFQYKFSLMSNRKYRATYNLASIAKRIHEVKSKGGFFSSSTVNSLTESNSSKEEFQFVSDSEQEGFEYDPNLRNEVKNELIARVISELAITAGQPIVIAGPTPPAAHGAVVLAGELQKVPNLYAQIGAAGLRIMDSVFGSSSAVSQYIKTRDGVAVQDVTEKRMFSYEGSSTFNGAGN